jgi:hypothetical protein
MTGPGRRSALFQPLPDDFLPKSIRRAAFAALAVLSLAIAALWLVHIWPIVPTVSIADFVLSMWRNSEAIEQGRWGEVVARWFEPFGGHIVAYTRLLQTINYVFFDYSPTFVKITGFAALVLAFLAYAWMVMREFGATLAGGAMLLLGFWLIATPTTYGLLAWPDSLPPYYSVFIVACLTLAPLGRLYARGANAIALIGASVLVAFAIIIGSGVGWSILVILPVFYVLASGRLDLWLKSVPWYWLLAGVVLIAALALPAREGALHLLRTYEAEFTLDEARRGLEGVFNKPDIVAQFFLATLATNFVLGDIYKTWPVGLAPLVLFVVLALRFILARKSQTVAIWLAFGMLGLLSVLLTTLTRWHFVEERGLTMASQYYSVFALPFHIGLGGLVITAIRTEARWLAGVVAAASAAMILFAVQDLVRRGPVYDGALRERAERAGAGIYGAANRNLELTAELSGVPQFVAMYEFGVMVDFQRRGKYLPLTQDYFATPEAFAERFGVSTLAQGGAATNECAQGGSLGRVINRDADTRKTWSGHPLFPLQREYVRFVGYGRDPDTCAGAAAFVLAFDAAGRLLCASRPSALNALTVPPYWRPRDEIDAAGQFDFSCPLPDGAAVGDASLYSVAVFSPQTHSLAVLPFDSSPADQEDLHGQISVSDGGPALLVNGRPARIAAERAGWLGDAAGDAEGDAVIFEGWALDRIQNRTANYVIITADGEIVYAAAPTVPRPDAEPGATLAPGRRAGFRIFVPKEKVFTADGVPRTVRVFALTEDHVALEVYYPDAFPFPHPN